MEVLCVVVIIVVLGYFVINWGNFPDRIPTHYNFQGVVDSWSNKSSIFVLLGFGLFTYIATTVISFFPSAWNTGIEITKENKQRVYNAIRDMLCIMKLVMVLIFSCIAITSVNVQNLNKAFLPVVLIVTFGVVIGSVIRIFKVGKKKKV